MNQTFTPPPADPEMLEVTLSKAVHLSEKLKEARAENQRLRQEIARLRSLDAQHRSSETATANYLAVCEEKGTLREACEAALPEIRCLYQQVSGKPAETATGSVKEVLDTLNAALAATAPQGEGHA
jgi:hypothetical protein